MKGKLHNFQLSLFLIFFLFLNSHFLKAVDSAFKGGSSFLNVYGNLELNSDVERAYRILELDDGNFVIIGTFLHANEDIGFLKISSTGDFIESRTYSWGGQDFPYEIIHTSDGGFLICGRTNSFRSEFGLNNSQIFILKLNSDLSVAWAKVLPFETPVRDYRPVVIEENNGYMLFGTIEDSSNRNMILVMKLDFSGGKLWAYIYNDGEDGGEFLERDVKKVSDGNYLISGECIKYGIVYGFFLKIDPDGNILWGRYYHPSSINIFSFYLFDESITGDIITTGLIKENTKYYLAITSLSPDVGAVNFWKYYPIEVNFNYLFSLSCDSNGGYFVSLEGVPENSGWTNTCGYLLKFNSSNDIDWAYMMVDGSYNYSFKYGLFLGELGYVSAGYTSDPSVSLGSDDVLVVKLNSNGEIIGGCDYLLDVASALNPHDMGDGTIGYPPMVKSEFSTDFVDKISELSVVIPETDVDKLCNGGGSGDINGDDIVNAEDFVLLANYLAGNSDGSGLDIDNGDMNNDGLINAIDLCILLNKVVGNI